MPLSKSAPVSAWIHDFVHSSNKKFSGDSRKQRIKRALGAYYGKQNEEWSAINDRILTEIKHTVIGSGKNAVGSLSGPTTPEGQAAERTAVQRLSDWHEKMRKKAAPYPHYVLHHDATNTYHAFHDATHKHLGTLKAK